MKDNIAWNKRQMKDNYFGKSIVGNSELWKNYIIHTNQQIDDLGWESVWKTEHSQRGILLKSLSHILPQRKHVYIEHKFEGDKAQGRIDLLIASGKKRIDEVWEIKDGINFISFDSSADENKIVYSINSQLKNLRTKNKIYHNDTKKQVQGYLDILEENEFTVRNSYIVYIRKIVFVPDNFQDVHVSKLRSAFVEIYKGFNDEVNTDRSFNLQWFPINSKLLTKRYSKEVNHDNSPFFKAKRGSSNHKVVLKYFAGIVVSVSKY